MLEKEDLFALQGERLRSRVRASRNFSMFVVNLLSRSSVSISLVEEIRGQRWVDISLYSSNSLGQDPHPISNFANCYRNRDKLWPDGPLG